MRTYTIRLLSSVAEADPLRLRPPRQPALDTSAAVAESPPTVTSLEAAAEPDIRAVPSTADDALAVGRWVLAGLAAGAVVGFVIGGIGGRLAMFVLRLTSPDSVVGLTSDDGFTIGKFDLSDTMNLVMGVTMLGGIVGVLYAALRGGIASRLRLPLWVVFWTVFSGMSVIHADGVDFTALEPRELSVALFLVLPAVAAAAIVLLVERWDAGSGWGRRQAGRAAVPAVLATFALIVAGVVASVGLLVRRAGLSGPLHRVGRFVVPLALAALAVVMGIDLVQEIAEIL